ncbi:hypothetical protein D3C71_1192600 [compost metagenome]
MFNTGARVLEIIRLRVADVVLDPIKSIRLHGKGLSSDSCSLWNQISVNWVVIGVQG